MSEERELKFVRLQSGEDLIGMVTFGEEYITIFHPLRVHIETFYEEGKQLLAFDEYLPQTVIDMKEIDIFAHDILFTSPVKENIVDQYNQVSQYFYNNKSKVKKKSSEEETQDNVVSLVEALMEKKNKPIH